MRMLTERRIRLARSIAIAADALQIVVFPFFIPGFLSPLNIAVDCVVALWMCVLLGWHIAFIPAFLVEDVPFLNLAPTWTIAVFFATRNRAVVEDMEVHVTRPVENVRMLDVKDQV